MFESVRDFCLLHVDPNTALLSKDKSDHTRKHSESLDTYLSVQSQMSLWPDSLHTLASRALCPVRRRPRVSGRVGVERHVREGLEETNKEERHFVVRELKK